MGFKVPTNGGPLGLWGYALATEGERAKFADFLFTALCRQQNQGLQDT